jgi:hypothetical protein
MVVLAEVARWQPSEIMNMPSDRRMDLADVLRTRQNPPSVPETDATPAAPAKPVNYKPPVARSPRAPIAKGGKRG